MPRPILSRPLSLLLIVTALFTFLIQSGELGTSDTTHRLQVTHSLWTGQPQVYPNEFPEFGLHGRGGRLYAWYGIGQSLLMLPADLVGSAAGNLPFWSNYARSETDPAIRSIFVSISTNVVVNVLTAFAAFHLLRLLAFSTSESVAGVLGLLCATTHLHYAQNMMENNYILLLTITGFALQYRWLKTGSRSALLWGSAALGLNLLTRLTTALDILGVGCFLVLVSFFARRRSSLPEGIGRLSEPEITAAGNPFHLLRTYLWNALPIYAVFLLIDRTYQFIRFGSWTNTYLTIFAREQQQINPALPANFPFNGDWLHSGIDSGIIGPFLSPAKSVFLFDPIFPLALLLTVLLWTRLTPAVRAFFLSTLILLGTYVAFYASYLYWAGDFAWGDRYISSSVELASLLAIPLLLRYRDALGRTVWQLSLVVTAASVAIQCASLAFWLPLEIYQMDKFGRHTWVVFLRFRNIAAFVLDKREAWGLNTPTMFEDPWDAAHITTWNFLPSLLRHIGVAPLWAVHVLYAVWLGVALLLVFTSTRLIRTILRPELRRIDSSRASTL
jgi:hypothetical protein